MQDNPEGNEDEEYHDYQKGQSRLDEVGKGRIVDEVNDGDRCHRRLRVVGFEKGDLGV